MVASKIIRYFLSGVFLNLLFFNAVGSENEKPSIFPIPLETRINDGKFIFDKSVIVLSTAGNDPSYDFLNSQIRNELIDKYSQSLKIIESTSLSPGTRYIIAGDITNPLIRSVCEKEGLLEKLKSLGEEGYILSVSPARIVIAANTKKGALFGYESLRQIIERDDNGTISVQSILIKDCPRFGFRGIKVYLPGRENIAFFKRFIRDFVAQYKFNKIILELNANMRLNKHPELNHGAVEFYRYLNFSRLDRPAGKHLEFQDSSHQDNADGGILEKDEVADLVSYMREFNIEVIPELPSLTHSYYLLAGHSDLAENPEQPYPDTYCPLKPEIYKIYFDVLDEYIGVIHPAIIHIGHDEWRVEKNLCPLCKGKDYSELYADDVIKIHDYLAKKGIITALWGDHLLESVTKEDHQEKKTSSGYKYFIPGALTADQVTRLIPKDIIVFNWFWNNINNDHQLSDFGFKQVYGNLEPEITGWSERAKINGVSGGAPSSWSATTEKNIGKDLIYDFLGSASLLWSGQYLPENKLALITEKMVSGIRIGLSGKKLPGEMGINIHPLNISGSFNSQLNKGMDSLNNAGLLNGTISNGNIMYSLASLPGKKERAIVAATQKVPAKPVSVENIEVNLDVNSIIFLHACAKPGRIEKAYNMIYNFDETAELLGWYEIKYEDGFIETIPVRYGVNILDWNWRKRLTSPVSEKTGNNLQKYAYYTTPVICSGKGSEPVTFFSYEWENPRYGKKITAISLKSVRYSKTNENAIILLAISVSDKSGNGSVLK